MRATALAHEALDLIAEVSETRELADRITLRCQELCGHPHYIGVARGSAEVKEQLFKMMDDQIRREHGVTQKEAYAKIESLWSSLARYYGPDLPPNAAKAVKFCLVSYARDSYVNRTSQFTYVGSSVFEKIYKILDYPERERTLQWIRDTKEEYDRTLVELRKTWKERQRVAEAEARRRQKDAEERKRRKDAEDMLAAEAEARKRRKDEEDRRAAAEAEAEEERKRQRLEERRRAVAESLAKIDALIGLGRVKSEIRGLANFAIIEKERADLGLVQEGPALHMVFSGNPGTGKTTVARILGGILKGIGLLEKGHVVEVDQSGLIAQYTGQTPAKTLEVCKSALGGILFIDEAYALTSGTNGAQDFGMEAVNTILKFMEDNRGKILVIAAGYSEEMGNFVRSNTGLESRFGRHIRFDDYSDPELAQLTKNFATERGMAVEPDCAWPIDEYVRSLPRGKGFANGRAMRNYFEKTLVEQAGRLMGLPHRGAEDLKILARCDFENANRKIWGGG